MTFERDMPPYTNLYTIVNKADFAVTTKYLKSCFRTATRVGGRRLYVLRLLEIILICK